MYWMLLPPSANAGRHIDDDLLPLGGSWIGFFHGGWDMVMRLFAPNRR
jgi:hypothetical protein